ncbi:MAG: hypothetical protein P1U77_13920 [Rubripirellula sp.]|jgi:hypothetical protein|nr:hypothetical protein [Rubripirellula sp.]
MTTQPCECRDQRLIQRIRSALDRHRDLGPYAATLLVTIENAAIILQGHLPSDQLRSALEPAVRQAGVLDKINNEVRVIG